MVLLSSLFLAASATAQESAEPGDNKLGGAEPPDLVFQPALERLDLPAQALLDIALAGERLVAVGHAGLIITSDDNGRSWEQASVPVSATLTALHFPTPQQGWAVGHGGVILHSADAGSSWTLQLDGYRTNETWLAHTQRKRSDLAARLETLADSDDSLREDLEFALEDAEFEVEDAEGAIEAGPADPFLDVLFVDDRKGFAAGAYGKFYATEDGGSTWRLQVDGIDNPDRFHLYAIHVDADGRVYLAGEAGLLYRSDDGGRTFTRYPDVYDGSLFGLLTLGDSVLTYGLRGNLFLQAAGSDDWESVPHAYQNSLYGGGQLAADEALLLAAGGRILRLDAQRRVTPYQHPARSTFSAALRSSEGTVWIVGTEGLATLEEAHEQ